MRTVAVAAMLAGCSGGSGQATQASTQPAYCTNVSGLYSYVFSNAVTNDRTVCPLPTPLEAVIAPTSASAYPGCSVTVTTANSCSESAEIACPITVMGFSGQRVSISTLDTTPSGQTVTGTVQEQATYDNGQGQCNASWDFTATRLHQ